MLTPLEVTQIQSGGNISRIATGIAGMMGLEKLMSEISSLEKLIKISNDKNEIGVARLNLELLERTVMMIGNLGEVGHA